MSFILTIKSDDLNSSSTLAAGVTTVGRVDGNDIVLPHHFISSRHAQIEVNDSGAFLTDLGSTNGTVVDGAPLPANSPRKLIAATVVVMGPYQLSVTPEAAATATKPAKPKAKPPAKKPTAAAKKPRPPKPPKPPKGPPDSDSVFEPDFSKPPVGLELHSSRLLGYLPGIYHSDFMGRFLGIFEAILSPLEWNADNFDLFLHPRTAPEGFLPWLANWFDVAFDDTWTEAQKRLFLSEAHQIFAMRGTRWSLTRILEIYTGKSAEIIDLDDDDNPFSFTVKLPVTQAEINPEIVEQIIEVNKPAHTTYKLFYRRE